MIPLALRPGETHLWCTFFGEIEDEALLARYRQLLNDTERAQELRFRFARDRRRYLVTRALVRTMLSRYSSVAPRELVFGHGSHGKPYLLNQDSGRPALSFNVSHTAGLIVLAISAINELGIDVERINVRNAALDIADRYFAAAEYAALQALPAERQPYRFFEYWTLKESYIKARGLGLSIGLDRFSFQISEQRDLDIWIHPGENDAPARWQFWQAQVGSDYLIGLCSERREEQTSQVIVRRNTPFIGDEALDYQLLRYSASSSES